MSYNINSIQEIYNWTSKINSLNLEDKSVLLVGGGDLGFQYISALSQMNIHDITVISQTGKDIKKFCNEFGIKLLTEGFEKNLTNTKKMDLVIIATPIPLLTNAMFDELPPH